MFQTLQLGDKCNVYNSECEEGLECWDKKCQMNCNDKPQPFNCNKKECKYGWTCEKKTGCCKYNIKN